MSSVGAVSEHSSLRLRVRVGGVVQGVGFRPHVYRLARELDLGGYVLNNERGVLLEVEGSPMVVERFLERLVAEAPPLASIERVSRETIPTTGAIAFEILPSIHAGMPEALVSPDTATCVECLAELNDPRDRRYRYPFINCTNCGPRFTIAVDVPYDRPLTTMAGFVMCELCRAEYEDPANRRFHAQPNACPVCGPHARLLWPDGTECLRGHEMRSTENTGSHIDDPVRAAAQVLLEGLIVAVKGIGGYHLACLASSQETVKALRERKHREDRPFALMALDVAAAEELVQLNGGTRKMLEDRARPIVIARRQTHARVADAVAPRSPNLGVMLPYTPLHHLLLADVANTTNEAGGGASESGATDVPSASKSGATEVPIALVMTSGNVSDEPIVYADEDAIARLAGIADVFLVHDRPIHMRTDDSVLRATSGARMLMRRSRGYVPAPIGLPVPTPRPVLACGAELKSTFCLARGERAWVSHHIGDLKNYETLRSFREGVEHFQRLFAVTPEVVAHDLHPDYLSTGYALEREGLEPISVQHHHAHLAACLAEHGELGPAVGAIFDGSGYGSDGTVWGGELLVGGLRDFERVGHLRAVRLPGGDRAVSEPWRMACSWLVNAHDGEAPPMIPSSLAGSMSGQAPPLTGLWEALPLMGLPVSNVSREAPWLPGSPAAIVTRERWEAIARLAHSELAPFTTSAGRLFDAVAALCGLRACVTYEGQAAIELEAAVDHSERGQYAIALEDRDGMLELDPRAAISTIASERAEGVPIGIVAARFHIGLARATALACKRIAGVRDLNIVVLSGGVFQNRILLELTIAELKRAGLRPLIPERLPPGDGGVSYGQVAVAAARLADGGISYGQAAVAAARLS
jgi:hydrogenase maturation protein HypF